LKYFRGDNIVAFHSHKETFKKSDFQSNFQKQCIFGLLIASSIQAFREKSIKAVSSVVFIALFVPKSRLLHLRLSIDCDKIEY
jgi:hypothetical protein